MKVMKADGKSEKKGGTLLWEVKQLLAIGVLKTLMTD